MSEQKNLKKFIDDYGNYLTSSFEDLWSRITIEPDKLEAYSVIGALLSRQVTLALEMANAPSVLNAHSAPLFLRAMVDVHIMTSWILLDIEGRSKKYIAHGLSEEKLLVEHYKEAIKDSPDSSYNDSFQQIIEMKSNWIDSQIANWAIEVNLGEWAVDKRKMSQETNCESMYKFAYRPLSSVAHSMWPHVSTCNSRNCKNPLHQFHLIPILRKAPANLGFLWWSCRYVDELYKAFVDKFEIEMKHPMPLDWWDEYLKKNNFENSQEEETEEE